MRSAVRFARSPTADTGESGIMPLRPRASSGSGGAHPDLVLTSDPRDLDPRGDRIALAPSSPNRASAAQPAATASARRSMGARSAAA